MAKLNAKALALTLGIIWGASVIIMGLAAKLTGWGTFFVSAIGTKYIGYNASCLGSIVGGIWGFVDGGICGLLIAWLYNKLVK